ncbi:MAG: pyridoxamine 5'-phosphate oxidase family protein [Dehalococcoidia bacterium]
MTSAAPGRPVEATDEEVAHWVQQKRERVARGEKVFTVEDLKNYQLDEDETWELITLGNGCSLTWVAEDGSPGGTYVKHAVLGRAAYLLLNDGDDAVPALQRDPRVSVVFDGGDGVGAVTVRGTVSFLDDQRTLIKTVLAVARRDGLSEDAVADRVRAAQPGWPHLAKLNPEHFVTFTHKKIIRG